MDIKFQAFRKKMERFNDWEVANHCGLSPATRMQQFIMLYDLGKMYGDNILRRMNNEHLNSIIDTTRKFKEWMKTKLIV